jgi:hypothetical protein
LVIGSFFTCSVTVEAPARRARGSAEAWRTGSNRRCAARTRAENALPENASHCFKIVMIVLHKTNSFLIVMNFYKIPRISCRFVNLSLFAVGGETVDELSIVEGFANVMVPICTAQAQP